MIDLGGFEFSANQKGFGPTITLKTIMGPIGIKRFSDQDEKIYQRKFISLCRKLDLEHTMEVEEEVKRNIAYDESGEIRIVFELKKISFEWYPVQIEMRELLESIGSGFNN